MIFEPQRYRYIFQDAVYSLAAGFLAAVINRALSLFLYKGKVRLFVKDMLMSVVFAVLVFSYCVSFANYNVLRWYNVLVALAGYIILLPGQNGCGMVCAEIISATAGYLKKKALNSAVSCLHKAREKNIEKHQNFTQKTEPDTLKEQDIMLYN